MRKYWIFMSLMAMAFLAVFALAESLHLELLTDPGPWLATRSLTAAGVGLFLLVSDVVLPVPASLVMIANGALFGFLWGTILSLVGAVAAAAFGFALGRWSGPLLARVTSETERIQANRFLERWGDLAIIASRPVPILAETVAVVAGTSNLGWKRFLLAAFAGSVPAAVLYSLTGSTAVALDNWILVFLLVLLVAGIFWAVGRRIRSRAPDQSTRQDGPGASRKPQSAS